MSEPTIIQTEQQKNANLFYNMWRPAIAWSYLFVCVFDFVIIPIVLGLITNDSNYIINWQPNTLKAGGLYHMSMLAIVGVTAWNRTNEKLEFAKKESN